jgi:hypothetical protein
MSLAAKIAAPIERRFLDAVVSDRRTLCFVLHTYAVGEAESEGGFFDAVLPFVDGGIARMVRKHAADEVRHAALISEQVVALGGGPQPIPDDLQLVRWLDAELGGLLTRPWADADEAAAAWMVLWALERRLNERLTLLGDALERTGDEPRVRAGKVLASIAADERRHLRFCDTLVAELVAPDRQEQLRAAAIDAEGAAFAKFGPRFVEHLMTTHSDLPLASRVSWRALVAANGLVTKRAPVRVAA